MPGFLLHIGATVKCAHGGMATPTVPNPRVLVGGQPTVALGGPYVVAGCALPPPPAANGPCVSANFTAGSVSVTSGGRPLLLSTSPSICAPTGTPLLPAIVVQTKAVAR